MAEDTGLEQAENQTSTLDELVGRINNPVFRKDAPVPLSEHTYQQGVFQFYYDQMINFLHRKRSYLQPREAIYLSSDLARLRPEELLNLTMDYTGALVTEDYERMANSPSGGHKSEEILSNEEIMRGFQAVGTYLERGGLERLGKDLKRINIEGLRNLDAMRVGARGSQQLKHLKETDEEKYELVDRWLVRLGTFKLPSFEKPKATMFAKLLRRDQ